MRKSLKAAATLAALSAISGQATAQIGQQKCLTPTEAEAVTTYLLPDLVRTLAKRCAVALPPTASLIQSGTIVAARYQVEADAAWPAARSGFDKLTGLPISTMLGERGLKPLLGPFLETGATTNIKSDDCAKADRLVDILQPLPARNMAMLIVTLSEFGSAKTARWPVKICPNSALIVAGTP